MLPKLVRDHPVASRQPPPRAKGLAWSFVELARHFVEMSLRVHQQVGSLGKILSQQTIGVLIGSALPWTLRVAEVNSDVGRQGKSSMVG